MTCITFVVYAIPGERDRHGRRARRPASPSGSQMCLARRPTPRAGRTRSHSAAKIPARAILFILCKNRTKSHLF